jgi:hypothetical protein
MAARRPSSRDRRLECHQGRTLTRQGDAVCLLATTDRVRLRENVQGLPFIKPKHSFVRKIADAERCEKSIGTRQDCWHLSTGKLEPGRFLWNVL